nr:RNA-directed DNA polymerase, eukaryota [Tanacetum cinerariifolium]
MGAHNKNSLQSKADQTVRISKSVFVFNFPDGCTAKDLWKVCNDYGTVVDVFIPNKKSKVGKRFAFVIFIKAKGQFQTRSYLNVVNGSFPVGVHGPFISSASVLVLDDSCVAEHDMSNHVMGKVKDVSSISNLRTLIMEEGFSVVNLMFLGGLWVMIECDNVETKANMLQHTGVKSWFYVLQNAVQDFVSDERNVWVDIEGVPLNVWSRETFTRIGKKWEEALDIEDNVDSSFGRKRLCIKTKLPLSILESFKVIFKGKMYMVRANELFTWNPIFLSQKEMEYTSDDDSNVGPQKVPDRSQFCEEGPNDDRVSDVEEVSKTNFEDNSSIPINHIDESENQQSEDPFNIYRLLRKQPGDDSHEVSSSLSHPPGFTPDVSVIRNENGQSAKEIPVVVNAKVMNNSQNVYKEASCDNGGSVLGVMEDMIRVGKAMGYSMDGLGHKTKKDWIKELTSKNKINFMAIQETKTHCVNHMDVKFMWGNSNYNYVYSEAVGNSGGILYVWEATIFKKDYATISDNFVAIYGTWLPSNSKVLFVAIYAPQQVSRKRILWDYVSTLIDRWNGEFISASGLVDVKIEGYMFTWSHHSGSKMSKLDRFLVSEGIFSIFPSITAVCLDRHLSDHRPIILCEVQADFGPIPFRFYHSCISLERFDAMVEQTWMSFSHNDANRRIRFKKKDSDLKMASGALIQTSKRLTDVQASDLERRVSRDEIRLAVWNCGENKSPGPDGSVYKVVTKVLANRLALVISDLISDTQSAFVANRQILDGPFILNELLHWCKRKKKQVMFFKVDFAKAYDSVRWGYLLDVQEAFGFGNIWCKWIRGTFSSAKASITVDKLRSRLSKWKVKTLSIGERLTLLKAVLGASPLYNMSIFKVPKGILNSMEAIRSKFFNGMEPSTKKITWAAWNKVLAWICDLSGDGEFRVKEVRNFLDNLFLPSYANATRWVKYIPIKINVFVWRARRDFLPTRVNLSRRGILLESSSCPLCLSSKENIHHVLFGYDLVENIFRRICRWWELDWQTLESFSDWNYWFSLIRLSSKVKTLLEGVFCVAWWSIWGFMNRTVYNEMPPRRSVLFDDIMSLSYNWFSSRCNRAITWDS